LQVKLLRYLEDKANESGIQVIVTTHSPTIAASTGLDRIKVLTRLTAADNPVVTSLAQCGLNVGGKFFLERWLDVTKSTLLFAKAVILVEGIAEALVVPELARIVLAGVSFGKGEDEGPRTLKDYGVSIISMGGIYFTHFMQLFKGYTATKDNPTLCEKIPIRCAGITDCDPEAETLPTAFAPASCRNPQYFLVEELAYHDNCRLFCNLKTFEYDLALQGNNLQLMARVYMRLAPNSRWASAIAKVDWSASSDEEKAPKARSLLDRVSDNKGEFAQLLALELSNNTAASFQVPECISLAVKWAVGID
ncbi:MAG TPA: TOPRIM nucleotidyl transferase/hydrolase domain-containing protein, partial [Pyrinomonadaceae bacterium]|nr:TOPRIM nucleotidyl transferase/hydrolase domain-containing protein [Pyrinomonadaceae bacterium]